MSWYFLPGPFADDDMLRQLFGTVNPTPQGMPATLPGHALHGEPGGAGLRLLPEPGSSIAGLRVALTDGAEAPLAFVMAAFGAAPQPVITDAGPALAFLGTTPSGPTEPLGAADWIGERRAHLLEMLGELVDHRGTTGAAEMPALLAGIGYRALARVRGSLTGTPVGLRAGLGSRDVEQVALARPYTKFFAIEEHALRHRRFDGQMSAVVARAVFVSGDAVTVLPFDPVRGAVVLIEQFRAGAHARRDPRPWFLEAVAGRCDPNETPQDTARREAREEAGIELGRLEQVAAYYTTPGLAAEHITAFIGEADLSAAGGVHGLAEEDEDIRVHVVPLEQAVALMADGEINNAPLLILLLWLERNRDRLVARWAAG